ncbi:hypothetical protein [Aeromonas sp.]|uniref:hypothetical protein n=1 Tax=Aeromonas sp. TaxID=647 RepID=UPI00258A1C18|nr:hypothetical protein [Aeromonas sp.]MCX7132258.1 hypothetical protein [Aeromonas sp.]
MQLSDSPTKQAVPFGVNGNRNPIGSTTPAGDNSASYDLGFPPITMILKAAGGLPPKGQDMNQILFELSALARWASASAINRFDPAFSAAIGGYPQDARVLANDGKTVWRSNINNNANDPNSVTTGWVKVAEDIASILELGTAAYLNVGNGADQIPDMNYFTGGLLPQFWQKLPNGLTFQGGDATIIGGSAGTNIVLPIPFVSNPLGCVFFWRQSAQITNNAPFFMGDFISLSTIKAFTSGTSGTFGVYYFAWGK